MAQIICTVERRYLRIESTVDITTGSIGSIQCSFTFDAEWDGLTKTAIFRDADGNTYPILITDDTCTVPNEAIADGCYLTMGVMGTRDGNVVVATEWKNGDLNTGCYTAIAPPSEDIYLQILNEFSGSTARVEAAAQKVQQSADEIQASLPAIHADAETAKAKANEATKAAGEAAKSRDKAKEYQDAAQASAADALASAQAAGESEENVAAMQSNVQELANQVAADKADVAAKAQAVDSQARQVRETAASFPLTVDSAKKAITDEGTKQVGLVSSEGTKQAKAVADKGVEQVAAVNTAGAAQISAATAQGDRAQQEADRAEQEANRAAAIDAYTKEDSRQSFANAFVGEKSGAMVKLSDVSENTLLRKATVQGATTEVLANPDAEKSPDNIASISGTEPTKVMVSGKNLYNPANTIAAYMNGPQILESDKSALIYAPCKPSTTYTVSKMQSERFSVGCTTEIPANGVSAKNVIYDPTKSSITITTDTDSKYIVAFVYNGNYDTVAKEKILGTCQIEEGQTATAYEPYSGTDYPLPTMEPLMSLPNGVCDEYDAVTGVETRRIGKLVLNGTETFAVGTHSNGQAYASFAIDVHAKTHSLPLSTHYLSSNWTTDNNRIYIPIYNYFGITDSRFVSKEAAQDILSAQHAAGTPVTIYYELQTPTTTQHDPQTVPAVYPTTTVYADDGNVAVSYNRDSNKVISALTNAIIALGGTLNV